MRCATIGIVMLFTAVAVAQERPAHFSSTLDNPVLRNATAKVEHQLMLPALDNGALVELAVEEGEEVEEGQFLGRIDDTEPRIAVTVASSQLRTAQENAGEGSRIQIEFAEKAAAVARNEYEKQHQAWIKNAITEMDVKRAELEWQKSMAQVKVRKLEQKLAGFEVDAKEAELEAAEKGVERRRLTAEFAGYVERTYRSEGEWVQAGEPILRLMDFTTMRVSGQVDALRYSREDVEGKPVTVLYDVAGGQQQVEFTGYITLVSPIDDPVNNEFTVRAEVANRKVGKRWLLPDNAQVTMTIHVN